MVLSPGSKKWLSPENFKLFSQKPVIPTSPTSQQDSAEFYGLAARTMPDPVKFMRPPRKTEMTQQPLLFVQNYYN